MCRPITSARSSAPVAARCSCRPRGRSRRDARRARRRIFSGGADLDPATYGQEAHPRRTGSWPSATGGARAAARGPRARHAGARGLPRLAGAERRAGRRPRPAPAGGRRRPAQAHPGQFADHGVELDPGTRLGALLGDHAPVKSHHHQGFGRLGAGLREAARAEDGTIEALEDPSRRFALGVLWHPEAGEDMRLFEELDLRGSRLSRRAARLRWSGFLPS